MNHLVRLWLRILLHLCAKSCIYQGSSTDGWRSASAYSVSLHIPLHWVTLSHPIGDVKLCAALRVKILQIALFESRAAVGISDASVASCVCVHVCSWAFLPLTGNYNFEFLNHRLFKSKAAPAGQMKVVILFPPSIILAFLSTICHYRELHLVICVLWPDTCAQREPICVGGVSGQRRRLIWDQSACRRLQEPRRVGSCARLADSSLCRCLLNECVVMRSSFVLITSTVINCQNSTHDCTDLTNHCSLNIRISAPQVFLFFFLPHQKRLAT